MGWIERWIGMASDGLDGVSNCWDGACDGWDGVSDPKESKNKISIYLMLFGN